MLKKVFGFLLLSICLPLSAKVRYVSDDLYIYMHSGPSRDYRIIGTVNAGSQVDTLKIEGEYTQIRRKDSKVGWVKSTELNSSPGLKYQLNQAKNKLNTTRKELNNLKEDSSRSKSSSKNQLNAQRKEINDLKNKNLNLANQLTEVRKKNEQLTSKLNSLDEDLQMEWFMRGGFITILGLIMGLIVPHLPRRQKRRDSW